MARTDINDGLKEGGRSETGGTRSHRMRAMLVISEVSLALVALIGAGLFRKKLPNRRKINPGFEPDRVLLSRFYLSTTGLQPGSAESSSASGCASARVRPRVTARQLFGQRVARKSKGAGGKISGFKATSRASAKT